jgi:hypothetical protein
LATSAPTRSRWRSRSADAGLTGYRVRRGERTFTVGVLGPAVVAHATREALDRILAVDLGRSPR